MMNDNELRAWLDLFHLPGLSQGLFHRLLLYFKSPAAILEAEDEALFMTGVSPELARAIHRIRESSEVASDTTLALEWRNQSDHHIVTLDDPFYPPLLREIPDPPILLFVLGKPESLLYPQIAVVGSRHCSVDGREVAAMFARDLARRGFSICSGLARGIDSAAHAAAILGNGVTVAVQGTGADIVYPPGNRMLASKIGENGALLSELPLGSSAKAGHFPKRNRIISGMSVGVIVVEAALQSGSLITARLAMEQNREVFAVPGSVRNPLSRGSHRLIRDGVTLVESAEQVLEQLGSLMDKHLASLQIISADAAQSAVLPERQSIELTDPQRKVLGAIGYDPSSVDAIVDRTGLSASEVQSALLGLELNEQVYCAAGRYTLA